MNLQLCNNVEYNITFNVAHFESRRMGDLLYIWQIVYRNRDNYYLIKNNLYFISTNGTFHHIKYLIITISNGNSFT